MVEPYELESPEPRNNPITDSDLDVEMKIGITARFRSKENKYMKIWKFNQIRKLVEKMGRFIDDETNVHLSIESDGVFFIQTNSYTKEVEKIEEEQN
jgi:hypothetical protein